MLARADALAVAALDQVNVTANSDAGTLAGLVEKHARLAGAEEVYVAIAPDLAVDRRFNRVSKPTPLADRFAVRASVAYKGSWVRRTRTYAHDNAVARANAWFADVVSTMEAGQPLAAQLAARVEALGGATLKGWMAEGCLGSYPLAAIASSRSPASDALIDGSFLVLTVELELDGGGWIGSAPLFVGRPAL